MRFYDRKTELEALSRNMKQPHVIVTREKKSGEGIIGYP
jgi:hypothetical protein